MRRSSTPGALSRDVSRLVPSLDRGREQGRLGDHLFDLVAPEPVICGEVARRCHTQCAACRLDEAYLAGLVTELDPEELGGDGALGEVVDTLETLALTTDELADVQEPLGCDLGLAPVPPRAALLGAAELPGRERSLAAEAVAHIRAALLRVLEAVPAMAPRFGGARRWKP